LDQLKHALGLGESDNPEKEQEKLYLYINLKLASSGEPTYQSCDMGSKFMEIADDLLKSYQEKNRLLHAHLCPVDQRIQNFIKTYLASENLAKIPQLPSNTFVLDHHGVARQLSIPMGKNHFKSDIVESYRIAQGVLHNPASDRRTTKGSFHIVEGGLAIPEDKKTVPKIAFAKMLEHALAPPNDLMNIPFTSAFRPSAKMFVSLLLRPIVCPAVPNFSLQKKMEIRFFAPGNLVSNLDFVESIFGNGGNPNLAEFNAALDTKHWTGHTGCVILAPHLTKLTKKEVGLPHYNDANELQRKQGMCWQDENEKYNDGEAFKITARDESGVIFTLLADNYYGYCKKEVKTQISFSANLFGLAEEEHAGGALAFHRRNHGNEYGVDSVTRPSNYDFSDIAKNYAEKITVYKEGYAIDNKFPDLIYVPLNIRMDLVKQKITWFKDGQKQSIRLQPNKIYMQPQGYKIEMVKHAEENQWHLIGTDPEGTFCHKPSTVSGGGKSEISKTLDDAILYGSIFVDDLEKDLAQVADIFNYDYRQRFKAGFEQEDRDPSRQPLSLERSLGSFIKLLTPSEKHLDQYNEWLAGIPPRIEALAFVIKRFYQPEWGDNWSKFLSVDKVDGAPSHELKVHGRKILSAYLRIGFDSKGKWRTFKVRQDFIASEKIQMEDDISASVVVPPLGACGKIDQDLEHSVKLVDNCEYRLFQRPDEAIVPGFDSQTEIDMSQAGNFIANYEALKDQKLADITDDVLTMENFTPPMRQLLQNAKENQKQYVVSSAHPRIVDGAPSKNPRYLQIRSDLANPIRRYIADMGARFYRKLPADIQPCHVVDAVLAGRRNNPPEPETGIRALAVYNPIHYQELPELFMDFIASLTGKSPSTTGAGSEGALTKGPFNALRPTADLNNALVGFILTGYSGFSSSAGVIGPNMRVDHDISLLVPEIWARLKKHEKTAAYMIKHDLMDKLDDFKDDNGQTVLQSRLGYRINAHFVSQFLGKIFDNPNTVFTEEILAPETQDKAVYIDGINNIVETQQRVAQQYINDGSIEDACPPLKALLYIMAEGSYQGLSADSPEFRQQFERKALLASDWYQERLEIKQQRDLVLWQKHIDNLQNFLNLEGHQDVNENMKIQERLDHAKEKLVRVGQGDYLQSLVGTLGADPLAPPR